MDSDEEIFEQRPHVTDGFGGRHYRFSRGGSSRQTIGQAEAGRMGPMAGLQLGHDIAEVATNGSEQAKRRLKMFQWFVVVVFFVVPATLLAISSLLG